MAKDKSKNKDKAVEPEVEETTTKKAKKDKGDKPAKKDKGGSSGAFARPSDAPAGGDSWSLTDGDEPRSGQNIGKLMLITPLRLQDVEVTIAKRAETKEVVVADVVVINEKKPEKSEAHEDVYIFGGWLKGSLKGYIGEQKVLARLVKEKDNSSSTGYVWKFEDADDDDIAIATEYVNTVDVFKQKKSK